MSLGAIKASGSNFDTITRFQIGNVDLIEYTVVNDGFVTGFIPNKALDGILKIENAAGSVTGDTINLTYPNITIQSFSPLSGVTGAQVNISGTNFYNITNVRFSGNANTKFTVINPQFLQCEIPESGIYGPIEVFSTGWTKTGVSSDNFTPYPRITGFAPASGTSGTQVTLSGFNFENIAGGVFVNGIATTGFDINNNREIITYIPTGNHEGRWLITGINGTSGLSTEDFTTSVIATGTALSSGFPGDQVTIAGNGIDQTGLFYDITGIGFNHFFRVAFGGNVITGFNYVVESGVLTGYVPTGALSGNITIYKNDGVEQWPSIAFYRPRNSPPAITSPCIPYSIATGTVSGFSIFGTGFHDVNFVRYSGSETWNDALADNITSDFYSIDGSAKTISITGYRFTGDQVTTGGYVVIVNALEGSPFVSGNSGIQFI